MNEVIVQRLDVSSPDIVQGLGALLSQLSKSTARLDMDSLEEILRQPGVDLFVASSGDGRAVGMLTLVRVTIPTGKKAVVEDVVVDEAARDGGVGIKLMEAAIAIARGFGARYIDLTSRPDREAANRLYRKIGFVPRETNVYRYQL